MLVRSRVCAVLATTVALAPVPLAAAGLLEEVVVTAQKREQNIQDVGISVSAFSGSQLETLGFDDSTDIVQLTPSLNMTQYHPTLTVLNIRGVSQNDIGDHLEPPVAGFVDGAYVSAMGAAAVQMFDIERVEVLRGPQGTLFGRNATGGLIHYVTRKPEDTFSASAEFTAAEYERFGFQGAVGGPLGERTRGRVAMAFNRNDGWWENRAGPDLRDAESIAGRAQLAFDVADNLTALVRLHYARDDSTGGGFGHQPSVPGPDGLGRPVGRDELAVFPDFLGGTFTTCPGCDAFGFREPDEDPHTGSASNPGLFERDIAGIAATLEWTVNDVAVTSVTDYLTMNKEYFDDTEASPFRQADYFTGQNFHQFSQELRASWESGAARWTVGGYFLDIDNNVASGVIPDDIGPLVGAPPDVVLFDSRQHSQIDSLSWALFGHLEYTLTEQWSVTGAVRYTSDEREMSFWLEDNFGTLQRFNKALFPGQAEQEFGNVSAKAQVDWRPRDDLLVYASWSRGHKAGNFAAPFVGPLADLSILPHDEEVLTSVEGGVKSKLLDGRAQLNASVFHYDYDDYQASFFVNIVQIIRNLDASVTGGEVELILQPTDRLNLLFGASFLDNEVERVGMPDGSVQDRGLPYAPDFTLNGLARYAWPVAAGELAVQADFKYTDQFCFTVVCHHTEVEDAYVLANARVSYGWGDGRWTAALFVNNLADTEYRAYALDSSVLGFTQDAYGAPRWIGGSIAWNWE